MAVTQSSGLKFAKRVGAGLLIFGASVTGLIIPWLIGYAIFSSVSKEREKEKQALTAVYLALNNPHYDPYVQLFPDQSAIDKYKKLSEFEAKPVGFLRGFYLKLSGQMEETEAQKMIRYAYEKEKYYIKPHGEQKKIREKPISELKKLNDIYTLLKTPFGQRLFARCHNNAIKSEKLLNQVKSEVKSKSIVGRLIEYDKRLAGRNARKAESEAPQNKKTENKKVISAKTLERLSIYKAGKRNMDMRDVCYVRRTRTLFTF